MHNTTGRLLVLAVILIVTCAVSQSQASNIQRWLSQSIYVPLYSHIYADDRYKNKPFALTATLSIRNTDPKIGFILDSVDYYDSKGKKIQSYLKFPTPVDKLASHRFIVRESDNEGGSGAKFLVRWHADTPISEPVIESVMIGTQMQQGISFISTGRVIDGTISKQENL